MDSGRPGLNGCTILLVEDQPGLARDLQVALEDAGAEVVVARGPQEAAARLRRFLFSVAVVASGQHGLIRELQQRGVFVVAKPASRSELLARLAAFAH